MPTAKLPLCSDIVFHKLFEVPNLLISLLNAILGREGDGRIVSLTLLPTQMRGARAQDKEVVLDLRATCQNKHFFHIELQVRPYPFYIQRSLHYLTGIYHHQLAAATHYRELRPVVSIHLLYFELLSDADDLDYPHNVFELRNRRNNKLLSDQLQIHTVEMRKFVKRLDQLSTPEDHWVYYLKHGHKMEASEIGQMMPEIKEADERLQVISQDRILQVEYERQRRAELDSLTTADDWHKMWWENAVGTGRKEGHKDGLNEGRKEGQIEEACAAVLDLCEVLEIAVSPEQKQALLQMDLPALRELRAALKTNRVWPAAP